MRIDRLDEPTVHRLDAATVTGAVTGPGHRGFTHTRALRRSDFDGVVEDLVTWRVHARAGVRVAASGPAGAGTVVLLSLAGIHAPCRVVGTIDEPDRKGFRYATLAGHPERGHETFVVERNPDGALAFTVSASSRPASFLARLGGPVTRTVQDAVTRRYLGAPDRLGPPGR